jgi:hypothetical protein
MIVRYEISERSPKMAFTEQDHAIEALLSDRAYEPLRMRIAVGRQERCPNHPNTCCCEEALHAGAPLLIAIANQKAIAAENPIDIVGQVAHRLDDERLVRMRRRAENMDPT